MLVSGIIKIYGRSQINKSNKKSIITNYPIDDAGSQYENLHV
jgi:hypothetical protein